MSERASVGLSHDCHLWTVTQERSLNSLRFALFVSFCVVISILQGCYRYMVNNIWHVIST